MDIYLSFHGHLSHPTAFCFSLHVFPVLLGMHHKTFRKHCTNSFPCVNNDENKNKKLSEKNYGTLTLQGHVQRTTLWPANRDRRKPHYRIFPSMEEEREIIYSFLPNCWDALVHSVVKNTLKTLGIKRLCWPKQSCYPLKTVPQNYNHGK